MFAHKVTETQIFMKLHGIASIVFHIERSKSTSGTFDFQQNARNKLIRVYTPQDTKWDMCDIACAISCLSSAMKCKQKIESKIAFLKGERRQEGSLSLSRKLRNVTYRYGYCKVLRIIFSLDYITTAWRIISRSIYPTMRRRDYKLAPVQLVKTDVARLFIFRAATDCF